LFILSIKRILHKTKVHTLRNIAEGVYVISFLRNFKFIAGQVVAIDLVPDGQPRLYSIASGENEEYVDILFDEKPDGSLTPFLSKLNSGDIIYVSEPLGTFTSTNGKAFWIASGTGVAPFVSMARSGLAADKTLIHGGRLDDNFYFSDVLESLITDGYVRCCSQQQDTQNYNGRLTVWLMDNQNLSTNCPYYLCGSPEMVVQVRDILIEKGIPFQNIISETYF
jgi:ferredoxin--NADP+ reductase